MRNTKKKIVVILYLADFLQKFKMYLVRIYSVAVSGILDSTSKCNVLKHVKVAETMVGSRFPLS